MTFELINKYKDNVELLPCRKTTESAGYDFYVAEDISIPPYLERYAQLEESAALEDGTKENPFDLADVADLTKFTNTKMTLVPTGVKAKLDSGTYLELSVRSSCPLKYWLMLANGVGIIDADYYNNPDNEGHIYFQIINLTPFWIKLNKGDCIGQGIIKPYLTIDNDNTNNQRLGGFGSTDA